MDYDGDGDLDILSGSYTGEVYLFVREEDGTFRQGVFLTNHDGEPLRTGTSITPEAHDLDGDGDLDLLIGTRSSGVFLFENLGSRTAPSYAAEGTWLKTRSGRGISGSNAHYADWDHDGVRDLVLGSERGNVVWHKNLGVDDSPIFDDAQPLLDIRQYGFEKISRDVDPTHPGSRTKVHVTDWNGDGRVDLLVGDVRWLYYTENPLTDSEERELAALQPRYQAARDVYLEASKERARYQRGEQPIPVEVQTRYEELKAAFLAISQEKSAYNREKTETHGFVWLYLRDGQPAEAPPPISSEVAEEGSVRLRAEARQADAANTFTVSLRLEIDAGWHTYAEGPPEGGYPVTTPSLELPEGFEQLGDFVAEGPRLPAADGSGAIWFVDEVCFSTKIRRQPGAEGRVQASVSFQVCNETLCLPASELVAPLDF